MFTNTNTVSLDEVDALGAKCSIGSANGFDSDSGGDEHTYNNYSAKMTTERHAAEYNMQHKNRGLALIFNHETFDGRTRLKPRAGTNVDCDNLRRILKQLSFEVIVYKDLEREELLKCVKKYARKDHTDNDCILIAILSHGESGYIYAKDTEYKLDSVSNNFTAQHCPTLAGKPKLFFIQACQGDRLDPGVTMKSVTETDGDSSMSYKIPAHADFLIAYSTIPGFYSWRNTTHGSWFMQSLCAEFQKNAKRCDILTLLTFVCQRVAIDFESYTPERPDTHQQKQIPCIATMLTRILRFSDKRAIAGECKV